MNNPDKLLISIKISGRYYRHIQTT